MIFWGATGQAKVLRECMSHTGIELVALFDRDDSLTSPFSDVPLLHGEDGFESWLAERAGNPAPGFLVAIGGQLGEVRVRIQEYLESHGLTALLAIHPTAFVAENASIAPGCQILANASVCADARLGRGCIVNTGATVDHECRLGDGVHIAPGAHVAGCVEIERFATVYTGAAVVPRTRIGQGAVVGAGAVVLQDVPSYTVSAGNPARVIEEIKDG